MLVVQRRMICSEWLCSERTVVGLLPIVVVKNVNGSTGYGIRWKSSTAWIDRKFLLGLASPLHSTCTCHNRRVSTANAKWDSHAATNQCFNTVTVSRILRVCVSVLLNTSPCKTHGSTVKAVRSSWDLSTVHDHQDCNSEIGWHGCTTLPCLSSNELGVHTAWWFIKHFIFFHESQTWLITSTSLTNYFPHRNADNLQQKEEVFAEHSFELTQEKSHFRKRRNSLFYKSFGSNISLFVWQITDSREQINSRKNKEVYKWINEE